MTPTEANSDWDDAIGFGSLHGPICPYCGEVFSTACCHPGSGLAQCPHCAARFPWHSIESPAGKAWITRTSGRKTRPATQGTAAIHLYDIGGES